MFLAGWSLHAWKKAITDLTKLHEEALEALKKDYDEKLKAKDKIITELKNIIDRLIKLFESAEGLGVEKVIRNLKMNKEKLNGLWFWGVVKRMPYKVPYLHKLISLLFHSVES